VVRHGCGTFAISWADACILVIVDDRQHVLPYRRKGSETLELTHVTQLLDDFVKTFTCVVE
ncbi:MAG: hypothetical protein ACTH72_07200, partial [Glutamicibacter ardleyensis]